MKFKKLVDAIIECKSDDRTPAKILLTEENIEIMQNDDRYITKSADNLKEVKGIAIDTGDVDTVISEDGSEYVIE